MTFKRYMAFAPEYYPSGGVSDCEQSFDTKDEAMQWLGSNGYEHDSAYIFDRIDGIIYNIVE